MSTKIEITKLRHYDKGYLNGFVDILIQPLGIAIHNITWFSKDGRDWVNLPSEKYVNKEGEEKYRPFVSFPDEAIYKGFQGAVTKAIAEHVAANPPEQQQAQAPASNEECPF